MKELKGINIKGNEYILVKDRVLYFNENYPNGKIETELLSEINSEMVVMKATITPDVDNPTRIFTGFSQATWGDGYINKTAAMENCETSAVGRALGMMGIGVIDSIASADEINKAQTQPKYTPKKTSDVQRPIIGIGKITSQEKLGFLTKVEKMKKNCPPDDWNRLIEDFGKPESIDTKEDATMFLKVLSERINRRLAKEKGESSISSDSEIMSDKEKAEFLAKIKNLKMNCPQEDWELFIANYGSPEIIKTKTESKNFLQELITVVNISENRINEELPF
jgi:hypothetical protein